jgi:sugar O-acyltransferase (sialic acid O-acetyltransferase NeuD family)
MTEDLIILGSGGLAQEYAWLVEEINDARKSINLLGFLDDNEERVGQEYIGYRVLGTLDQAIRYPRAGFISGVGDPRVRKLTVEKVEQFHPRWANLVSPTVRLHKSHRVGSGVMVGRYTDITVGCDIGNHVMLNIHAVIGHAVRIGDFSVVSPNVTINGEATIGRVCYVGANAFVRNVTVGDGATIGAGSVVTKDVAEDCVVAGVPAKVLHEGKPSHQLTRVPGRKP